MLCPYQSFVIFAQSKIFSIFRKFVVLPTHLRENILAHIQYLLHILLGMRRRQEHGMRSGQDAVGDEAHVKLTRHPFVNSQQITFVPDLINTEVDLEN